VLVLQCEQSGRPTREASRAIQALRKGARHLFPQLVERADQLQLRLSRQRPSSGLPVAKRELS
jgi:hypothetical protein